MAHLRLPAAAVAGELVHEHDRRSAAGLLVVEFHAVVGAEHGHIARLPPWTSILRANARWSRAPPRASAAPAWRCCRRKAARFLALRAASPGPTLRRSTLPSTARPTSSPTGRATSISW